MADVLVRCFRAILLARAGLFPPTGLLTALTSERQLGTSLPCCMSHASITSLSTTDLVQKLGLSFRAIPKSSALLFSDTTSSRTSERSSSTEKIKTHDCHIQTDALKSQMNVQEETQTSKILHHLHVWTSFHNIALD